MQVASYSPPETAFQSPVLWKSSAAGSPVSEVSLSVSSIDIHMLTYNVLKTSDTYLFSQGSEANYEQLTNRFWVCRQEKMCWIFLSHQKNKSIRFQETKTKGQLDPQKLTAIKGKYHTFAGMSTWQTIWDSNLVFKQAFLSSGNFLLDISITVIHQAVWASTPPPPIPQQLDAFAIWGNYTDMVGNLNWWHTCLNIGVHFGVIHHDRG